MTPRRWRERAGCWLHERWRFERAMCGRDGSRRWLDLCNRGETVEVCGDGIGRACRWSDSSRLTVCRVFPAAGGRLLRRAWHRGPPPPVAPVSVVLPVRGAERAEPVAAVVAALRRIAGAESEILLCEHDTAPRLAAAPPAGCRAVFVPAAPGEAFNKSRAMNAGARAARHPVLVLHDADVLPPGDYLARAAALLGQGWEAVRPFRFLFLLDEEGTRAVLRGAPPDGLRRIADVQQNFPGIATVIRRDVYADLGGHDEGFEGWGGEDLEFLDRLRTRRLYPGGFLAAVHLWHPPAPKKASGDRNAAALSDRLAVPREERVAARRQEWSTADRGGGACGSAS